MGNKRHERVWEQHASDIWTDLSYAAFAGKKKGSMFSVPEGVNAKVGVIGSGKAPTDYKAKSRHDFAATDDAE